MTNLYSIIIYPQDVVIHFFQDLKKKLKSRTGTFSSCDSVAHITVLEFEATDDRLIKIILKLIKIANDERSFDAFFNEMICSEKSLSVFALPDKDSNQYFKKLLSRIRKDINIAGRGKNSAHISIGRNLSIEQLRISEELFSDVKFDFRCEMIGLRKFNSDKKQFEIIRIFPFLDKPDSEKLLTLDF